MGKGQISIYVIASLVALIILSVLLFQQSSQSGDMLRKQYDMVNGFSEMRTDIQSYVGSCVREAISLAMDAKGIREETLPEFESFVSGSVSECSEPMLETLEMQGYDIIRQPAATFVTINEDSMDVVVSYPLNVTKDGIKTQLADFEVRLMRTLTVTIPGGRAEKEVRVPSTDGKAELIIPAGTEARDPEGNPVEKLSIKIKDLHFDGLANGAVVSNLVYDMQPDKTQFSAPVQLMLDIEGLTVENLSKIKIGTWNEDFLIWEGLPTSISNGKLIANITHFCEQAAVDCEDAFNIIIPRVYEQKYAYCENNVCRCSNSNWKISDMIIRAGKDANYRKTVEVSPGLMENAQTSQIIYGLDLSDGYREYRRRNPDAIPSFSPEDCEMNPPLEGCFLPETNDLVIPFEYIEIDPSSTCPVSQGSCSEKIVGSACTEMGISGNCLKEQDKCVCRRPDPRRDKILGYCDPNCVGGMIASPEDGRAAYVAFEGAGNACIDLETMPRIYATCDGSGDICGLVSYENDMYKIAKYIDHAELMVRGVEVFNNNMDACASAGVVFSFYGRAVNYYGPPKPTEKGG